MIISIADISKSYGAFQALKHCSATIARGEVVVICGPSGSGKSTLIKTLNGLEKIDSGRITIGGFKLTPATDDLRALRSSVGMVFQHFELFPHLSVLGNVMLAQTKVLRRPRPVAEKKARALLERVGLGGHIEKHPQQLSGGQQQRVAIARALALDPEIMLFDEPTSALDPEMVGEVLDVMTELAAGGMTMLCVTHEMGFARRVADRVFFMDNGEIVETAASAAFFDAPQTDRAQHFLSRILTH
ncbi:MAG: amino acid ABC transporter ATP-binding protein [Rhodospirillaceae bacterium]|nr:amino acid ABC transporter ATP-binding protein [Rhodospirillaceae bacterium]